MTDPARWTGPAPPARTQQANGRADGANLADILERVLDKGIVIAGDIQVNLLDIELLTIKIRLVVASVDRAKEMGIDWWERDPTLSAGRRELEDENRDLRARVEALERGDRAGAGGGRELTEPDDVEPDEPDPRVESRRGNRPHDEPHDDEPADDGPADEPAVDEPPRRRRASGGGGDRSPNGDGRRRGDDEASARRRDDETPVRRRPGGRRSSPGTRTR